MTSMMTARRGTIAKPSAFDPTSLGGLQIWLDASRLTGLADGDPVATWTDLSGNSRNLAQGTSAQRPTYKTAIQNGSPVVRFDGVDDRIEIAAASFTQAQPCTLFFVHIPRTGNPSSTAAIYDSTTPGTAFDIYHNGGGAWTMEAAAPFGTGFTPVVGTAELFTVVANGASSSVTRNGSTASGNAGSASLGGLRLGANRLASPSAFNVGDIGEFLVYSGALSSGNRLTVATYLKAKWGTP